ncbi:MAG: DUF2752 domain-containing protein [Verrucomicrobia bacterium]|jgi:hypothetical protein|nr:DUF2752 domain-containing protein [Verrucomicrobiota bacterium]
MRIVRQRTEERDRDVELAVGVLFIPMFLILSIGMVFLPEGFRPRCWLNGAAGIPCPACGGFRAIQLLCSGELWAAFCRQPFVILGVVAAFAYSVYAFSVVFGRVPAVRLVDVSPRARWAMLSLLLLLVLVDWAYVLVR